MSGKKNIESFQDVAKFLKEWRKKNNISQEEFSRFAKVQRTWYSKIERGQAENITLNSLLKLLEEMGCELIIVDSHAQPVGSVQPQQSEKSNFVQYI